MPVLITTSGSKVDLPWIAVHALLSAYYDRRGSFNDTKRGDDGIQWTVIKSADSMLLQKEVDMFLIVSAKGKRDEIEQSLYRGTVRLRNVSSSLDVAKQAGAAEVIAQFEKDIQDTHALIDSLTVELKNAVVPDLKPESHEFPARVDDLKFGLPDYGIPAVEVKKDSKKVA